VGAGQGKGLSTCVITKGECCQHKFEWKRRNGYTQSNQFHLSCRIHRQITLNSCGMDAKPTGNTPKSESLPQRQSCFISSDRPSKDHWHPIRQRNDREQHPSCWNGELCRRVYMRLMWTGQTNRWRMLEIRLWPTETKGSSKLRKDHNPDKKECLQGRWKAYSECQSEQCITRTDSPERRAKATKYMRNTQEQTLVIRAIVTFHVTSEDRRVIHQ